MWCKYSRAKNEAISTATFFKKVAANLGREKLEKLILSQKDIPRSSVYTLPNKKPSRTFSVNILSLSTIYNSVDKKLAKTKDTKS